MAITLGLYDVAGDLLNASLAVMREKANVPKEGAGKEKE